MARLPDIERRLLNWARWKIGCTSGGLGYAATAMRERVDGEGYDAQAHIPTVDTEAEQTEQAVQALDGRLRMTVETFYIDGGSERKKLAKLCCSKTTLHARIDEAHRALSAWLSGQAAAARDERARVERLQRVGK